MRTLLDLRRKRKPTASQRLDLDRFYKPFPQQELFRDSGAKYRLFGGAAGPGKTKALLMEAIRQADSVPGSDRRLDLGSAVRRMRLSSTKSESAPKQCFGNV